HLARHALEPDLRAGADSRFILTHGQQVSLCAPGELWVDVVAFERAAAAAGKAQTPAAYEAALALYEGDLLPADPYADWAAARREQLRQTRQELLAQTARLYAARGALRQSIERWQELLASDAADETAHRELMRLYAQTGGKHQALRQYWLCCAALQRELAAAPERATVELYEQIAAGRFPPRAPPPG